MEFLKIFKDLQFRAFVFGSYAWNRLAYGRNEIRIEPDPAKFTTKQDPMVYSTTEHCMHSSYGM